MIEYNKFDSPMSPQSFLGIVSKRRKVILILFSVIVASIVAAAFIMPPVFRSTAKVMVKYQENTDKSFLLGNYQQNTKVPYDQLASELLIFKMRSILEPVVSDLKLDQPKKDEPIKDVAEAAKMHDKAVEKLARKVNVEREKDTNVFSVSFDDTDANFAAKVVEKIVTEYIMQRPSIDRDDRAYDFFDKQIQMIEKRINELEQKGMMYKRQQKVLLPDKQTEILFSSVADFDKELTKIRAERISKEARLKIIKEQIKKNDGLFIPTIETTEGMGSKQDYLNLLKKTLFDLELKKNALAKKYTPKHPELASVLDDIRETKQKLRSEIQDIVRVEETKIKALKASEDALAQSMGQVVGSISNLSKQSYELDKLTIGIKDLKLVHSMLVRQREEARISANKQEYAVQVRLLEPAIASHTPVKPNRPLLAALAVLLGIIVSFGTAFFLEYFDHSVNTIEDAQNCLGLPILAAIPDFHPDFYRQIEAKNSNSLNFTDMNFTDTNQKVKS